MFTLRLLKGQKAHVAEKRDKPEIAIALKAYVHNA